MLRHARQDAEVLVSGGVHKTNVQELLSITDGAIVGMSLKKDGKVSKSVDAARCVGWLNWRGRWDKR